MKRFRRRAFVTDNKYCIRQAHMNDIISVRSLDTLQGQLLDKSVLVHTVRAVFFRADSRTLLPLFLRLDQRCVGATIRDIK